jgi:uncharacterized membrane protein YfcA
VLILLPGLPVATILGTNKFASCAGTTIAVRRYAQHVTFDWSTILPAAIAAFVFSFLGSRTVALLNTAFLRPVVLILLIVVAIYVFFVKDLGLIHQPKHRSQKAQWLGVLIGATLGFYDGFFGPGTGSFLIFFFVGVFGFDFLAAIPSRNGCAATLASNLLRSMWNLLHSTIYRAASMLPCCCAESLALC